MTKYMNPTIRLIVWFPPHIAHTRYPNMIPEETLTRTAPSLLTATAVSQASLWTAVKNRAANVEAKPE